MEQRLAIPKQKNYALIDAARIYCAFLVVVLHSVEVATSNPVWNVLQYCFFKQAVPYFFIVSGFFFAKKLYRSENKLKETIKYVKGNVLLYVAWAALWFPYTLSIYMGKYPGASFIKLAALLARSIFLAGTGVYWYILVMAEAAVFVFAAIHFKKEKLLYAVALVGLFLGYCYEWNLPLPLVPQINQLFYVVFSWGNNVIMMGLPFMAIGVFFAQYAEKMRCPNVALIVAYCVVSGLHVLLYFKHVQNGQVAFLYPVQAALLFLICLKAKPGILPSKVAIVLREGSAAIYFMHTVFIYEIFDRFFTIDCPIAWKCFGSIALSLLTYILVRITKIKPLYWLFGMKMPPKKEKVA